MKKSLLVLSLALNLSLSAHALHATGPYPPSVKATGPYPSALSIAISVLTAIVL
jgi:hypothetical protein